MPDPKLKLDLDLSGYKEEPVSTKLDLDLSGYNEDESKKKRSIGTYPSSKLDSGTSIGSSDGKGFPKIDTNSIAPNFDEMKPAKPVKTVKNPKPRGFASEVFHKLATGSAQLGADIAAVPELVYETFSMPQNAIADYFDLPQLHTDSDKFKKTIGVKNAVKDYYKQEVAKLKEESAKVDEKYKYGVYDSFKNGNYKDGFSQLTNSFAESLPATASIMLGGAYAKTPQLLAASTMMFGAGKNEELKDYDPDMTTNARVINALGTGLAEGAFETIGSGSIGAAAKGIIEREGTKKAVTILKDGLVDFYKESLKKNPLITSIGGEGIEEWATQVTQNAIDVATGAKPQDYNVFTGGADAFIGGVFGGAVFGGGLKGLEKVANHQDKTTIKSNTKKVFELQKALENPDISETTQAEIHKSIDGLVKTNQELVQKNIDHAENLHPKVKEKLVESDAKIDDIKSKVKEIKLDNSITDSQKEILLEGLKNDFSAATRQKNDILEGKTTAVDVLPLKEQDKLKREALKELTVEQNPDGSKNITIDDQQITERANKNYLKQQENESNQDTSIAETGTQTEVQEQKENTKVEPKIAKAIIVIDGKTYEGNNHAEAILKAKAEGKDISNVDRNAEGKFKLSDGTIIDRKEAMDRFGVDRSEMIIPQDEKAYQANKDYAKETGIPEITIDEKLPQTDIDVNGNVQPRVTDVGESGVAEQENTPKESIPSAVDGGEGEIDSKVNIKKVKSVKGATYDVHFDNDGNISKIISPKDGREIPKFREVTDPKTGELKLQRNGNYSKIEADALGTMTDNQSKEVKVKTTKEAIDNIPETDSYNVALKALANGQKVSFESIKKELGNTDGKWATNQSSKETLPSIEKLSEQLWENNKDLDQQETRNALIDIIGSHSDINSLKESVVSIYNENIQKQQEEELRTFMGGLSQKDMAMYESVKAEEDYFSELSDQEIIDYLEKQYEPIIENKNEEREQPKANDENGKTESTSLQERNGKESDEDSEKIKALKEMWNQDPIPSGETNKYDSGNTIDREHGPLRNEQSYEVQKDLARVQVGLRAISHAKEVFGSEYVEKTLSFINESDLSPEKKATAYVLLENEMDARVKANPKNVGEQKLQDLVRAKSQEFLANSARAIGAGRFRVERFRELVKNGFSEEDFTNAVLTSQQIRDKEKIQKLSQVTPDDVNAEDEFQDMDEPLYTGLKYTQEDFDRELQKAKDELGKDYNLTVFENLKRQAKKDKLSDKKEDVKIAKAKVLEDIRKVVRESMGQMSVNPLAKPIEFATLVTKLAKLHIQDGALSLEEVANNIYNDLKDMSKDISKESIFNILKSKPKRVISESTKRKIYISLLNKNIESLDTQIADKKRNVVTKEDKYKNDEEIKSLREIRKTKQEELAKIDPSYAESRKLATDLKLAQKSLDEYQRRIDEDDFSIKGKDPKTVNAKLKKLRDARDAKRKEFLSKKKKYDDSLKEPVVPSTKEELADKKYFSDVNNKINSLSKRIDDLKTNKQKSNDGKSTVWNDQISELENELKDLREKKKVAKERISEKEPLSEDEISQKRIAKKIEQREKILADLIAGKKKDVTGKNSDWSEEISKVNSEIKNLRDSQKTNKKQEQTTRGLVKQALIESGFGREITVKTANGKEKRQVLDWKKLAGEEGSVEKIRRNVEEVLKSKDYSKKDIKEMKNALEKEYVRLSSDVIEKGLNELENRNIPRKPNEIKSAAKRLAELNNYGLFEDNKDSYEHIINNVLGLNELNQKAFEGMKEIAKGYSVLLNSGYSEIAMKGAINELSRKQARLLSNASFLQSSKRFKILTALAEITNLSTRFKLVNLGNLNENISSGIMARAYNDITDLFINKVKNEKTTNKELKQQSSKNAKSKLKGIVLEAAESYGDTSSLLLSHSKVEDYFNESTTNKAWHALLSSYTGRPVLEGADSFNKILLTEAKMVRSAILILEKKGMTNKEALDYVSTALTGESMDDAKVKAKELIESVNEKSGKKILNDSKTSIESLASDIVKDALVSGGQMTQKELEAVYNAAYKSAGRDIGHVSNNRITDEISFTNSRIEEKISSAIKEKDWRTAAYYTGQQIIWRNFIYTFVGGGTNWFVKGLQKAGNPLSLISLNDDIRLKAGKELDITTEDGIKNMEKVLYRNMNLRSTAGTIAIGTLNALLMFAAFKSTGADDDLDEWLKKNAWAKKFFDKMAPDVIVAMLAFKNKEMGRYYSKMINQKPDFFDDQKNIQKVLDNYTKGFVNDDKSKVDKASGILGEMIGNRFDLPGPLKLAKDIKQVYKGAVKGEYDKQDYYKSGFWNGFLKGGVTEAWGLRPEPNTKEGAIGKPKEPESPEEEFKKQSVPKLPGK